MKGKEADWRSAELMLAATFGGIMSYLVTKLYDSENLIWAGVILLVMVIIFIAARFFNHFRPNIEH